MSNFFISPFRSLPKHERLRALLVFTLSICLLIISFSFFALSINKPYLGIVISRHDQGWEISDVDPNGLAMQAGLGQGDIPIVINGQQAEVFLEKYEKTSEVTEVLVEDISVIDKNGIVKSVSLEGSQQSWQSLTELIIWFIVCIIFWITGFYVFLKKPSNLASILLCLCSLIFGLAISGQMAGVRHIPAAFWFSVIAAILGPWLLLHFFLILPEERTQLRSQKKLYLIYVPALLTLVLFPLVGYADGQPLPGFRFIRLLEYVIGFLAVASVAVINYFHSASPRTRQQMKILLVSCLAALLPFIVLSLIPETILGETIVPASISIIFIIFIPLGMGYAVITQKLMDIDIIIRRGLVYGFITVIMTVILSGVIYTTITYQESWGITQEILIALSLGILATILFGPLKRAIEVLLDKFFYKDRYDYRQIIKNISASLELHNDSISISRLIVGTAVDTLNLAGACLFTKTQSGSFEIRASQGKYLDSNKQQKLLELIYRTNNWYHFPSPISSPDTDLAFIIPLVSAEKEIGFLCISRKNTNQDFSSSDLYLIQGLASVAAVTLHSTILIRDVNLRDTFVSIASHELRTPMSAILGYAELLLQRDPPQDTRKNWLQNIIDNGWFISEMIDDLLNVTRIQSGKIVMRIESVDLRDLINERLKIIKEMDDAHIFDTKIDTGLPKAAVDRDKFGQILVNLLDNAVKYSPSQAPITISAHFERKRNRIVVCVVDEGIGISPEDRESLFTTFHRIQRPETQGIRGSGLGLYIVKEWTEAMEGEVWLESELNKGSKFYVSVPIADPDT